MLHSLYMYNNMQEWKTFLYTKFIWICALELKNAKMLKAHLSVHYDTTSASIFF